ncbi:hypothetical protein HRI_001606800 [Hibiscus trionum]|uniref:Phorbol-ester/DAG-type domain-containing protein n=1 Tax=Hibiscus trionum TaxID=183268 RepID=A0A9W7HP25_HIBTR|nr:hypothetical protein HRI_001606800 [Hibiscus trionum]
MDIKLSCNHLSYLSQTYVMKSRQKRCEECGGIVSGDAFTCMRCCVWLHASCVDKMLHVLPQQIMHPFHLHHPVQLYTNPLDFSCHKCMYLSVGYRYRCSSCDFNLDLICASSLNDELSKDQELLRKKMTILHYSHGHILSIFKYRKIGKEDYCLWCIKRLRDSEACCGCTECEFYLHSTCRDKIPRRLSHTFHPGHPLRLSYIPGYCSACRIIIPAFSPCYTCEMCDFRLDFDCAKLLPTQKLGCHDHLLTYFNFLGKGHEGQDFNCKACDKPCGGASVYRCMQCHFSFHLRCVVPSWAEHRYHRHPLLLKEWIIEDDSEEYYCDICEKERNPNHPVYFCQSCTFIAHIECVLDEDNVSSSSAQSMENKALVVKEIEHKEETNAIRTLMQPIFHSHQMYEVTEEFKGNTFCYGCRLVLDGPSYFCKTCHEFYLHKKCAKLPYEIQHPFHYAHPLNLYTSYRPGIGRLITCDECKVICLGFIYFCELCNFKLDVKCAALITHNTRVLPGKEGERVTELQHRFHTHRLVLGYCHDPINEIKCTICELPILGPAYFCPDRLCNYILHESCLRLPQMIQVPFHPEHMLVFRLFHIQSNPKCYACPLNLKSFTFAYNCEHCHLNLHPVCANYLKQPLKCESHLDDLYYFGPDYQLLCANYDPSWATHFICDECEKSCQGESFYRCIQCRVNFHLSCIPIPEIVKSKHHIHPLVLKDSFVEDDSGKYYCDFCEEERNPKDHVYYCQECDVKTIAHIECVLAEVEDNMVEIRKNRPQRSLKKKRHEGLQAQPMPAALHSAIEKKLENFPAMVAGVWTDDRNLQLEAATQFKNLLSDRNPPNDEVIQAGVIPHFVEFLTRDDFPQLQYEVAWALSNIASGTSENRKVLIDHGVVPVFVKLLGSPSDNIREHAARGLGNIACYCHASRDLVLSHGALLPLLALLNEQANFSLVGQAPRALSNLCSGMPAPPFDQVKPALPTLARLIHSDDEEALVNACRALYYLSAGTDDQTRAVFEAGVCGRLVELLLHPSPYVLTFALGTIANFFVDDMQTQAIFEANTIVRAVALLRNDAIKVQREAARVIRNATCRGTKDQIKFLVSQGCIKPLCDLLNCSDPDTVTHCLVAIINIMNAGEADKTMGTTGGVNLYAQTIEEAGRREKIENLTSHDNTEVSETAAEILETYRRE